MNSPLLDVSHLTVSFATDEGLVRRRRRVGGVPHEHLSAPAQRQHPQARPVHRDGPLRRHVGRLEQADLPLAQRLVAVTEFLSLVAASRFGEISDPKRKRLIETFAAGVHDDLLTRLTRRDWSNFSDEVDSNRDLARNISWHDEIIHQISQFCAAWYDDANKRAAARRIVNTLVDVGVVGSLYGALAVLAIDGISLFSQPPEGDNVRFVLGTSSGF